MRLTVKMEKLFKYPDLFPDDIRTVFTQPDGRTRERSLQNDWYKRVETIAINNNEPELAAAAIFMAKTDRWKISRDNESTPWTFGLKNSYVSNKVKIEVAPSMVAIELMFEIATALHEIGQSFKIEEKRGEAVPD